MSRRAALALPFAAFASAARAEGLRQDLQEGIARLRRAAAHRGLTGSWDGPGVPVRADLLPPATEASIAAIENETRRLMPPGLLRFFRETSAGLAIDWKLPGGRVTTPEGLSSVAYAVIPPEPFSAPGPPPSPTLNAGGLSIRLQDLAGLGGEWQMWRDVRRDAEQAATDPVERAHHRYHAALWERGFPFGRTMGGDIVAIDLADPAERLMVLRHDGDDAPVLLLGQDLPTHLSAQARLLFPGFETFRMELFANEARGQAAIANFAPSVESLIREHDLFLPQACVLDADAANAAAWRGWMLPGG